MADQVLDLAPVNDALRQAIAPAVAPTLPDGTTLVSEAKPQSIQDAIKAARDKGLASATPAPAASAAPASPPAETTPATDAAGDAAADDADAEPVEGEGTEGADDAASESEESTELVIELEARLPNGQPIVINAPDPETYEALQRLQNGYMRGEQARAVQSEAREVLDEFEEFREGLRLDPVSTIESGLSVDQAEMLARSLLTHPALLPRLMADLEAIATNDPEQVERIRERAEAQRLKLKDQARGELEGQRAVRQNARDIQSVIGRLVPQTFTDEQREFFYRDARYDIQEWQQRNRQQIVPPNLVAQILAPRLKLYGAEPATRRGRAAAQASTVPASPAAAAAPAGAPRTASSARPVERVKAQAERRQLAAAAMPGAQSVGRPNPLDSIPPDADVKTAIAKVRSLRRVG